MRDTILQELSIDNVMKHTRYLAEELPERFSGNVNERKAAAYLEEAMKTAGIPVTLHEFTGYTSLPLHSRLQVLSPEKKEIPCIPFMNIPDTPRQGIEGELVDVRSGGEEDLQGRDIRGKIILAESSYSPARQEKVRLATARGAAGALVAQWGLEEPRLMVRGNAKAVWGNPTPETLHQMPRIPALGITKADLSMLRQLLSRGPVRVNLTAQVDCGWKKLILPVGKIEGSGDEADQFLILGGHYDAWGNGATDNANGNGLVLEVARVLCKHRQRLNRGIWIGFWSGHEAGTMAASSWLVDRFWDELRDRCLAYFNVDSPGMKGTERFTIFVSPELADFTAGVARETVAEEPDVQRLARTGDQSFFGIGLPAMNARSMFSPAEVQRMANATLGWWNHGYPCHDTMDKVDPGIMAKDMRGIAATAYEICTRPVLPMSFLRMADEMVARLEELNASAGEQLQLGPVGEAARNFRSQARKMESLRKGLEERIPKEGKAVSSGEKQKVRRMNRLSMRLSRILTPAFASVAGRYGQDPYGLTNLKTRFPGLYYAPRLSKLDPHSDEYHLILNGCLRDRNRISDALQEALHRMETELTDKETAPP
jgi:Iap family predicted aminopeptidase